MTVTERNGQKQIETAKFIQVYPSLPKFSQVKPSLAKISPV